MLSMNIVVPLLLICRKATGRLLMPKTDMEDLCISQVIETEQKICSVNNSNSEQCTKRVAIRSHEPYSFYSKDVGFTKGIEIELVKKLANWSHFNLELEAVGEQELKEKNFDVIIGAPNQMKDELIQSIDFEFDDLTWCVENAGIYPPWLTLVLVASREVWIVAVIASYITGATLYAFYNYYHNPKNYHYCTGIAALCIFSVPVPYNPTHGIARIHFGIILIYGLLTTILINSFVFSIMTKEQHQYQIHTTDELMYYKYKILVDGELIALHKLGDDEVSSYVKQNYEFCKGTLECLNQLMERSNLATIVPRKVAKYFESQSSSPIFCFASSETFNRVTRSLMLSRSNSHLLNKSNSFIRQAMETGHLLKWEVTGAGRHEGKFGWNGVVVLTIDHFYGPMVAYAIAMTMALTIFIGERLAFKNIQKGDAASFVWKWLDKYIFSPERIIWKQSSAAQRQADRTQSFIA